jgi:hypothetical protein
MTTHITKDARPKIIKAEMTIIVKMGYVAFRVLFWQQRLLIRCL